MSGGSYNYIYSRLSNDFKCSDGYCVYYEMECDYNGECINCPHNTAKEKEWFEQDEAKAETDEISDRNLKMWHDIYAEEKRRERS